MSDQRRRHDDEMGAFTFWAITLFLAFFLITVLRVIF